MTHWTTADIPDQTGRLAIVTGTGGIGLETAIALARAGAEVIVAGRNPGKGTEAIATIRTANPAARARFEQVDLANLASVAAFGDRMRGGLDRVDVLVNNAGVMTPPQRQETSDGFELQLGINHLGHFALTAQLMPLLRKGRNSRVISLGSVAARAGQIDFDDLNAARSYKPMPVYAQSKLACVMFAFELQRRSLAGDWGVASIAAHPGVARTDLLTNAPGRWDISRLVRGALPFLFQPAAQGALPILFAATDPDAVPGGYYGPDRMSETRGYPAPSKVPPQALDRPVAARLWDVSAKMTGAAFPD